MTSPVATSARDWSDRRFRTPLPTLARMLDLRPRSGIMSSMATKKTHGASISAAKSLLDLVVSRPKPDVEPSLGELEGEGFDLSTLSTEQLRRSLSLTEENIIECLDEEALEEKVARVVDVAERFMADPRDVSPSEVSETKALLASMRHYDRALAPTRSLRVDWRGPLMPESDIPPAPRSLA